MHCQTINKHLFLVELYHMKLYCTCCYAVPFYIILSYFKQHNVIWCYGKYFAKLFHASLTHFMLHCTHSRSQCVVWTSELVYSCFGYSTLHMINEGWAIHTLTSLTISCSTLIWVASLFLFWLDHFISHFSIPVKKDEQFVLWLHHCLYVLFWNGQLNHILSVCIVWNSCVLGGNDHQQIASSNWNIFF